MEKDSYLEGIKSAWLGEQMGEAFFSGMAERTSDESLRSAWQTLARLEHVTGNRMAELLETYGEAPSGDGTYGVGEEILSQYLDTPHMESMARMKDVVEKAIVRFDQLLAVAPEADVPAVQFLVQHEEALLSFVEKEIAGDREHSLEAAEKLIG